MKSYALFLSCLTLLFLFAEPAFTETSSIEVNPSRHLDEVTSPESFVTVQLNSSLTGDISGLIITERIPSEFKFINSSSTPPASAAKYNQTASEVKWLFISLQQTSEIAIKYTVEVPISVSENTYTFEGYWNAVSAETEASGVSPTSEIHVSVSPTSEPQVDIERASSTISCNVSQSTIQVGEDVTVSGTISPIHANVRVTLNYTKPDTSIIVKTVTTSLEGYFQDTIKVDSEGTWSVIAGWEGDEDTKGAESSTVFFSVENSTGSTIEENTVDPTTTENPVGSTIPIHIIAIVALVVVAAVIIIVILARRHGFAGGN
jgi:hypothetical protein